MIFKQHMHFIVTFPLFEEITYIYIFFLDCKKMSYSKAENIEKRIEVLDGLVAGSVLTDDILTSLTTRDGLLDALLVLYEECSHDYLIKKNKHVSAFIRKCRQKLVI
jgi:hypothetical protein